MNKLIFQVIVAVFLGSCSVKKTTITNDFSIPPKNIVELIERVDFKNNKAEWLNLKGRARIIKKDEQITLNINIKSINDSIIWLSARGPFNIEIIRAQLTPDSIYFINRTNSTYSIKPAAHIKDLIKLDLSFYDLQDIITASSNIIKKNYKMEADAIGFNLFSDNSRHFIANNYRIQNVKFIDNKTSLEFSLENYQERDNFPRRVTLKIASEETLKIIVNYSQVEFNKPQKILFEIPDSYDKSN